MPHTVRIHNGDRWHEIVAPEGANLREVLLARGFSPYKAVTRHANCGGRGFCATCGVRFDGAAPAPQHWHDRLAARFGYPRLSCQIAVDRDLAVRLLPDKLVWGRREETVVG